MSWQGVILVNVVNLVGGEIYNLSCSHWWSGNNASQSTNAASLALAAVSPFNTITGGGGYDEWSLNFTYNGTVYCFASYQCEISHSDVTSGQPITVNLLPPTTGFSIMTPISSPCTNVAYCTNWVDGKCVD